MKCREREREKDSRRGERGWRNQGKRHGRRKEYVEKGDTQAEEGEEEEGETARVQEYYTNFSFKSTSYIVKQT